MTPRRTHFYLDKGRGRFMGVCAGIADYTGVDVTFVRVAVALLTVFATGGLGVVVYLALGFFGEQRPHELDHDDRADRKFWQKVRARPGNSIRDVRASFRDIDRRLADVETHFTSQNRRLADEIEALR